MFFIYFNYKSFFRYMICRFFSLFLVIASPINTVFCNIKVFIIYKVNFITIFSFVTHTCGHLRQYCITQCDRFFTLTFSMRNFVILDFTFRSMVYFVSWRIIYFILISFAYPYNLFAYNFLLIFLYTFLLLTLSSQILFHSLFC